LRIISAKHLKQQNYDKKEFTITITW